MKTCLQLASSTECNMQVRLDHFDQMLSMIQESNIGEIFYILYSFYNINHRSMYVFICKYERIKTINLKQIVFKIIKSK